VALGRAPSAARRRPDDARDRRRNGRVPPLAAGLLEQQAHGRYRWIGPFDPAAVAKLPGELFFGPDGFVYGLARLGAPLR
jgi:hypothetical protein